MDARSFVAELVSDFLSPPPMLSVPEWAEQFRVLDKKASAEPGPWRNSRTPYAVEPMDCLTAPGIREVVLMWASQTSKTEVGLNWVGRTIQCAPGPILWVTSTDESAKKVSRRRFDPMLSTPPLDQLVSERKSRDSDRTTHSISFQNGYLGIVSAHSPSALSSDPIQYLGFDEVDRYSLSSKDEGDPISLGLARQTTFDGAGARTLYISSPDIEGTSRIEALFLGSDQRYFMVQCHKCGDRQRLVWPQVKWPKGKPHLAEYECPVCSSMWTDAQRWESLHGGIWVPTADFSGTAGFHLSQLYSSFVRLGVLAQRWVKAQGKPELLQAFINTVLGETFSIDATKVEAGDIRKEAWGDFDFPAPGCVLVGFTDVQHDRLESTVVALGPGQSVYPVEHRVFWGNTDQDAVWMELEDWAVGEWARSDGRKLRLRAMGVDCGDRQDAILEWVHGGRRGSLEWMGMKGKGRGIQEPVVSTRKPSRSKKGRRFFVHNVDAGKNNFMRKLMLREGPGQIYYPIRECFSEEYFKQLTAEKLVRRYVHGFPRFQWEKKAGTRNEALDCIVGCLSVQWWKEFPLDSISAQIPRLTSGADADNVPPKAEPPRPARPPVKKQRKPWYTR